MSRIAEEYLRPFDPESSANPGRRGVGANSSTSVVVEAPDHEWADILRRAEEAWQEADRPAPDPAPAPALASTRPRRRSAKSQESVGTGGGQRHRRNTAGTAGAQGGGDAVASGGGGVVAGPNEPLWCTCRVSSYSLSPPPLQTIWKKMR